MNIVSKSGLLLLGLSMMATVVCAQTFTVNTTDDVNDGVCNAAHCSLREAIRAANQTLGPNTVAFNIPGAGPHVIAPNTTLPTLQDANTVIDGTTQPGYFPGMIVLQGGGPGVPIDGIEINAANCSIFGLHIRRFPVGVSVFSAAGARIGEPGKGNIIGGNTEAGISIAGPSGNAVMQSNRIGVFPNGTAADPNGHGILIDGQLLGNILNATIGGENPGEGNLISGNALEGIFARGAVNLSVLGNIAGLNAMGTAPLPNGRNGIAVTNSSGLIIGNAAGGGNVFSGNGINGVNLTNIAAGAARVENNIIGLNPGGNADLGNTGLGIFLSNAPGTRVLDNVVSGNGLSGIEAIGTTGLMIEENYIGLNAAGSAAIGNGGEGITLTNCTGFLITDNVVSGNQRHGVYIQMLPEAPVNGLMAGNRIGTNAAGTAPLGNALEGISVADVSNLLIGGSPAEGNLVSGNGNGGIRLSNCFDVILGSNLIGTDATGALPLANTGPGVNAAFMSEGILIGGSGMGNTIAFNTGPGVFVTGNATGCTISENSIFCNNTNGIEIEQGANDDITAPDEICATTTNVTGIAEPFSIIELFRHDHNNCSAQSCQGKEFLGTAFSDATGRWSIGGAFALGDTLTATATNLLGSTSEFSQCVGVIEFPIALAGNSGPVCPGALVQLSGTALPPAAGIVFEWSGPGGFTSDLPNPADTLAEGVYSLTLTQGFCRSLPDTTEVVFLPIPNGQFQTTLCPGESLTINGTLYDANNPVGTETLTAAAVNGCDSILSVNLSFFPPATGQFQTTLCPGTSITVNGTVYNAANPTGTEILPGVAANGCDSILSASVNFFPPATGSFQTTLCPGTSITVNGTIYNAANPTGTEILTGVAANGCDSILSVSVNFFPPATGVFQTTICPGTSITVNGTIYNAANPTGTEILAGVGANGCDSILSVSVNFFPPATGQFQTTLCPGTSITVNGTVYNAANPAGTEILTGVAANGCDSILSVSVNFFPPATGSFQTTLCPGTSITVNGQVYNEANRSGMEFLPNASVNGCDSTFSVNIDFFPPATGQLSRGICPDEIVVVNGQIYDRNRLSGTEVIAGGSTQGCDSTVTISLFLLPVPETNFATNICPGARVVVNGTVYDENRTTGTEILRGRAANGCDSIVHVHLTVDTLILTIQLRAANCMPQEGGQITFFSIEGGVPPYSVSVNSGPAINIDPYPFVIDGLSAGVYNLTFADGNGCLYREPVTIPDNPLFNISSDTVVMIRRGQTVQLGYGFDFMTDQIRWTPAAGLSCSDCINPEVTPDFSTVYQVAVEFFGCSARQTVRILVDTRIPVFAPNAFSPNRDNVNDRFTLFAAPEDVSRITMLRIFDRWGGMVFEGKDMAPGDVEAGWDGTSKGQPCNSGVYIFAAEVESVFGDKIILKGEINLMR